MSAIVEASTPEECVEQLVQAVVRQDVLAVLYYSGVLRSRGAVKRLDDAGSTTKCSALAAAVAHSPTLLSLLILSLLLQLGASPTAGNPSAWDVACSTNNGMVERLLEGTNATSWECQTAQKLLKMALVEAEQWITLNLEPPPLPPSVARSPSPSVDQKPLPPQSPSIEVIDLTSSPPPQEPSPPPSESLSAILVCNIPPSLQTPQISAIFGRLAGFSTIMILEASGNGAGKVAFVRFEREDQAQNAMRARQGMAVHGRTLDLRLVPSAATGPSKPSSSSPPPSCSATSFSHSSFSPPPGPEISVRPPRITARSDASSAVSLAFRNIPPELTESALFTLLSSSVTGGFQSFRINYTATPAHSFIDLNDPNDVPLAISALHGLQLYGHNLIVEQRQIGRTHPFRLFIPTLPADIFFAGELESYLVLMGAEGLFGVTVHESLRRGEGQESPVMYGYCNFQLEAEMYYAMGQLQKRGVAAERDQWNYKTGKGKRTRDDSNGFHETPEQMSYSGRGQGGDLQTSYRDHLSFVPAQRKASLLSSSSSRSPSSRPSNSGSRSNLTSPFDIDASRLQKR